MFVALWLVVVFVSRWTDEALGLPAVLPGWRGEIVGIPLLAVGLPLWVWCVFLFRQGRGTPVPSEPPRVLVTKGPYRRIRNPMLTGVFLCLFGLGFCLHSLSMVALWTPLFIAIMALELKIVEEPELERRLGECYREYRKRVPMFLPKVTHHSETATAEHQPGDDA